MTHEHFRKSLLAGALSLVFAVGLPLAAQAAGTNASSTQTQTSSLSSTDHKFIEDAARGGVGEVQLGQLAAQKAQSDEVKQFGQRMVSDHSKANDKLKQVATQKNINLPTEMDSSSKREYDKLQKLSGAQFDREYMKTMVSDHQKDIKEFQKEAKSGKDADVKAFADGTLPTLEDHLNMAKRAEAAAKNEKQTTAKAS